MEANNPEAYYLEGLRYALLEKKHSHDEKTYFQSCKQSWRSNIRLRYVVYLCCREGTEKVLHRIIVCTTMSRAFRYEWLCLCSSWTHGGAKRHSVRPNVEWRRPRLFRNPLHIQLLWRVVHILVFQGILSPLLGSTMNKI